MPTTPKSKSEPNVLNNLLKAFRVRKFPSLAEAAHATKISADYLSKVENGILAKPSEDKLKTMIEAYGCTKDWGMRLDALWGKVVNNDLPRDTLYNVGLPIEGRSMEGSFTRRAIAGAIPSELLLDGPRHETLVTPAALFASWDRPIGVMQQSGFFPGRWIDQEFALLRLRQLLEGDARSVFVLPINTNVSDLTDDHASVECVDDIVLVYDPGLLPQFRADPDMVSGFLEDFEAYKAKAYPPAVAVRLLGHLRDAWYRFANAVQECSPSSSDQAQAGRLPPEVSGDPSLQPTKVSKRKKKT